MASRKLPLMMGLLLLLTIIVSPTIAVDDPVCPTTTTKLSRASFPEGFLFGTATAAFQPLTAALTVASRGFRNILKYIKNKYANPEIIIMENGYGEQLKDKDSVELGTADHNRKYYLQRHLLSMHEAICIDKVRVTVLDTLYGHCWTTSSGKMVTRIDLDSTTLINFKNNLTRYEKESGKYYRDFLSKGVRPSAIKRDEL